LHVFGRATGAWDHAVSFDRLIKASCACFLLQEQKKKELEELEATFAELGISPAERQEKAEQQQQINEKRRRKKEKKEKGEEASPAREGQPEGQAPAPAQESTEEGGTVDPATVSACQL